MFSYMLLKPDKCENFNIFCNYMLRYDTFTSLIELFYKLNIIKLFHLIEYVGYISSEYIESIITSPEYIMYIC